MSQGPGPCNQKTLKDVGTCSVCWASFKIQQSTGRLHKHGHRDSPCTGSDKLPAAITVSQPSSSQIQSSVSASHSSGNVQVGGQPSVRSDAELTHPPWVRLVSRIPRAARGACRQLLAQILQKITKNPSDKAAWKELLHFGPVVLAKPKRGGANRNLSNIINRRIAEWDKEGVSIVHHRCSDGRKSGKTSEDSKLAAAVANKLEAGNFRAAVRIICSSDTLVEPNQD